jgi:hypothetical protein
VSQHRRSRATTLRDTTDTAIAMAMLWAIPVLTFLYVFMRL